MSGQPFRLTRRTALAGGAAMLAGAAPFIEGATLLVAGPGGPADGWADWLSQPLGRTLSQGQKLRKDVVGGIDGVTAANQFEARTAPDGDTALLLPGSAAMAWLAGDPRARFDAAHWVPAMAAVTPGLILSRIPASRIAGGTGLRVAASAPAGAELPAMLALDLLGANWTPVFGLDGAQASDALAGGQVDAICITGRHVPDTARDLQEHGAAPLFTLGFTDTAGIHQRESEFPAVPTAWELFTAGHAPTKLQAAWRATAAAAGLDMALVLPQLTPAAAVALWRRACSQSLPSVQAPAAMLGVRPVGPPGATASVAAVLADQPALLELRSWLAARLNYRPA